MKLYLFLTFCLSLSAASAALLPKKHWPAWRGADSSGSTDKGSYVAKFSDTENVLWKTALPGKGCSTPIVWGEKIVLTCAAEGQDAVLAYDWSGKQIWQTVVGPERKGKHRNGSGSNPSVVTDGKGLFALFKSGNFASLTLLAMSVGRRILPVTVEIHCTGTSGHLQFLQSKTLLLP